MLEKTLLHNAIKSTAEGFISKHKTKSVSISTFEVQNGEIVEGNPITSNEMPDGDDGIKAVIDIIAEAVAQEVIAHIKTYMEIQGGTITTATLPFMSPLMGAGGGVPGPVTIPPASIAVINGKITIPPGQIK